MEERRRPRGCRGATVTGAHRGRPFGKGSSSLRTGCKPRERRENKSRPLDGSGRPRRSLSRRGKEKRRGEESGGVWKTAVEKSGRFQGGGGQPESKLKQNRSFVKSSKRKKGIGGSAEKGKLKRLGEAQRASQGEAVFNKIAA